MQYSSHSFIRAFLYCIIKEPWSTSTTHKRQLNRQNTNRIGSIYTRYLLINIKQSEQHTWLVREFCGKHCIILPTLVKDYLQSMLPIEFLRQHIKSLSLFLHSGENPEIQGSRHNIGKKSSSIIRFGGLRLHSHCVSASPGYHKKGVSAYTTVEPYRPNVVSFGLRLVCFTTVYALCAGHKSMVYQRRLW